MESTADGDATGLENRGSFGMGVRFACSPPFWGCWVNWSTYPAVTRALLGELRVRILPAPPDFSTEIIIQKMDFCGIMILLMRGGRFPELAHNHSLPGSIPGSASNFCNCGKAGIPASLANDVVRLLPMSPGELQRISSGGAETPTHWCRHTMGLNSDIGTPRRTAISRR